MTDTVDGTVVAVSRPPQQEPGDPAERRSPSVEEIDAARELRARWAVRWKPPLNAFAITFADRVPPAETT